MRGNKPKPTKLKLIEGEKNKQRINQNEPQPMPIKKTTPPDWLQPEAKKEWARVAQQLIALGIVTDIDKPILIGYCVAWGKFVEAEKKLNDVGQIYKTKSGNITTSPYTWISNKSQEQILKYSAELGIGASARARIKVIKDEQGDDL